MDNINFTSVLAMFALAMHCFSYFEITELNHKLETVKREYAAFKLGCLNGR